MSFVDLVDRLSPMISRRFFNNKNLNPSELNINKYQSLCRSINREPSRRSVYLSKFLRRRPTYEELKAQGIVKVCYDFSRIFVGGYVYVTG